MIALQNIFVILAAVVIIKAEPKCKVMSETDVVCTAGKEDYQLVRGLVSDNKKTTRITLRSCKIYDVELESFNDLFSLQYLDLSKNKIEKLKLGVLDEPKQLTHLNLSYNGISEFPLGLFDQTTNIQTLDLKGNRIIKLELGIFDPLKDLKYLDLSSNALVGKELNPYIFDQSPHISFMDFSRNNMVDAPENLLHAFQSLEFLNLDRCFLKEVPSFAVKPNLRTVKHIILSTNQISALDNAALFVNMDSLQELDFTGNIINSINGNLFTSLKKLQKISLKNNKLTNIPDSLFRNMPKLIVIHLNGNQIEDIPVNAFRGSPLKYLNLSHNKITYLIDNFCLELKNTGANLHKVLFSDNPWQCACLLDLIKEVKRLGIEYNSSKYNGVKPVCVTTNEFNCKRHQNVNNIYIDMYNDLILKSKER